MDLNSQEEDALEILKKKIKKGFFRQTKHVKSYWGGQLGAGGFACGIDRVLE